MQSCSGTESINNSEGQQQCKNSRLRPIATSWTAQHAFALDPSSHGPRCICNSLSTVGMLTQYIARIEPSDRR